MGLILGLIPLGYAQDRLTDKVMVDLPNQIQMNGRAVPAGRYELRQLNNAAGGAHVMFVTNEGGTQFEAAVTTIPALANNTPDETRVILQRVGANYYLDKVWVAGKDYGYEFELPADAKALLREGDKNRSLTLTSTYRPAVVQAAAPPPQPESNVAA